MSKVKCVLFLSVAFGAGSLLTGCGTGQNTGGSATDTSAGVQIPEKMSGIAELPEADQAMALEQRICPVSEKLLGSMGKPVKLSVKEQDVFLCCPSCEETIRSEPDKYLAKLNDKK